MEAAERGEINCIIVKDLSRFGREYIDAGQYIEKVFPQKGIRFIAINDHYDSLEASSTGDGLIVPFKNLINDSYSRDIPLPDVPEREGRYGVWPEFDLSGTQSDLTLKAEYAPWITLLAAGSSGGTFFLHPQKGRSWLTVLPIAAVAAGLAALLMVLGRARQKKKTVPAK